MNDDVKQLVDFHIRELHEHMESDHHLKGVDDLSELIRTSLIACEEYFNDLDMVDQVFIINARRAFDNQEPFEGPIVFKP